MFRSLMANATRKCFSTEIKEIPNIEQIESFLLSYPGGEINLSKEFWNDGIALLKIDHAEKRNALSGKMMVDLKRCVQELENWKEGKAVIFCGEGPNFCSGGDLDFARSANTPTAGLYMSYYLHNILKSYRKLPFVTVSLVHGPALGGGAELSMFSDFLVVADNVKIGFVHGRMGIMTAWGGATRLVQILGERKALEMLLSSKIYSSQECMDLGLAYKVVDTSNKLEETLDFVKTLTVHHSSVVQSYKRVTNLAADENFETSLFNEMNEFYPKWGSSLNKEALDKNIKHIKN